MILLDTSGLLAALDGSDSRHGAAAHALAAAGPPRLLSPFVLAEVDYLVRTKVGPEAQRALLGEVARGAYRVESFSAGDVDVARAVMERWSSQELDLADASIVVLAHRQSRRARSIRAATVPVQAPSKRSRTAAALARWSYSMRRCSTRSSSWTSA
ncbi:MAG: PIN domain-containing protein [Actinobacteria bacterium]|nr:MAG: PIN domain-containing protein [Actinomycetota bacterium]